MARRKMDATILHLEALIEGAERDFDRWYKRLRRAITGMEKAREKAKRGRARLQQRHETLERERDERRRAMPTADDQE